METQVPGPRSLNEDLRTGPKPSQGPDDNYMGLAAQSAPGLAAPWMWVAPRVPCPIAPRTT